jgi:hypothetical protein
MVPKVSRDLIPCREKGRGMENGKNFSRVLALKMEWNHMTKLKQFRIQSGTWIIEGRAASQGLGYPGGIIQKYILDPTDLKP